MIKGRLKLIWSFRRPLFYLELEMLANFIRLFSSVVGFRRSTRVNVWARWFVRWGIIVTLSEGTLPCWLWSSHIEEKASVIRLLCFFLCAHFLFYDVLIGNTRKMLVCMLLFFSFCHFLDFAATELVTRSIKVMMESGCEEVSHRHPILAGRWTGS